MMIRAILPSIVTNDFANVIAPRYQAHDRNSRSFYYLLLIWMKDLCYYNMLEDGAYCALHCMQRAANANT